MTQNFFSCAFMKQMSLFVSSYNFGQRFADQVLSLLLADLSSVGRPMGHQLSVANVESCLAAFQRMYAMDHFKAAASKF